MNKFSILFVILICFLTSCGEVTNPSYIDDIEEYLPLAIGNYWVYDVYDSLNNVSHIDSMVVVSDTVIKYKKMFVVYNFRDEFIRDTGYYCVSDYSISLYGKVLMPLLWTPDHACFSKQTKRIFPILDYRNTWNCRDSVLECSGSSIVHDEIDPIGWSIVNTIQTHTLTIYANRNRCNQIKHNSCINVDFEGNRVLRIIDPYDVKFPLVEGYEYFDNNRAVVSSRLLLRLQFAKGIGIISSYECTTLSWKYCQTRTLLRYNVK